MSGAVRFEHVRSPKRVPDDRRTAVRERITALDRDVFGGSADPYWRARRDPFEELSGLVLAWDGATLAGFYGYQLWREGRARVFYLDVASVRSSHRRQRVGMRLALRAFPRAVAAAGFWRPLYFVSRAASAETLEAFTRHTRFLPRADRELQHAPDDLVRVAERTALRLSPDCHFDPATFVAHRSYPAENLVGLRRDDAVAPADGAASYIERFADFAEGDAVIVVGRLRVTSFAYAARMALASARRKRRHRRRATREARAVR